MTWMRYVVHIIFLLESTELVQVSSPFKKQESLKN